MSKLKINGLKTSKLRINSLKTGAETKPAEVVSTKPEDKKITTEITTTRSKLKGTLIEAMREKPSKLDTIAKFEAALKPGVIIDAVTKSYLIREIKGTTVCTNMLDTNNKVTKNLANYSIDRLFEYYSKGRITLKT